MNSAIALCQIKSTANAITIKMNARRVTVRLELKAPVESANISLRKRTSHLQHTGHG